MVLSISRRMVVVPAALVVAGTIWEGLGALGAVPEVAIVVFWSLAVAMVRRLEFLRKGV